MGIGENIGEGIGENIGSRGRITSTVPIERVLLDNFETGILEVLNPEKSDPELRYLWNQYTGDFTEGPDPGLTSITTTDPQNGAHCLMTTVTQNIDGFGAAYIQFRPYVSADFAWYHLSDMIKEGTWQFDTYNRFRFWAKIPADGGYDGGGNINLNLGTYFNGINAAPADVEGDGGNHYYHKFDIKPTGEWHQFIISFHADYVRGGDATGDDPGVREYPTNQAGWNYFDAMNRFYFELENNVFFQSYPQLTYMDNFELYYDPNIENILQVFNMAATYVPSTNEIVMNWSRNKLDDHIFVEVRYAFSSIHDIGWANASSPPNNRFDPPNYWDYNNMYYENNTIDLTEQSSVFFAVKPDNSDLFTQIEIPL